MTGADEITSSPESLEVPGESWSAVDHLVQLFRMRRADEAELIETVCRQAVRLIPAVRDAGVVLAGGRHRLELIAATGECPRELATMQQRTGAGPCLSAAATREVVHVDDLALDRRWSEYAARAVELGIGSVLCLPLRVDRQLFGTFSLFSARPHTLDASVEPVAKVLAVLAALTLSEFRGRTEMETALASRDLIGQAKGILMATHRITADEAFALLAQHSQRTNTRLTTVAASVAETGTLDIR